jgi:glycosyltransferase involved in cell wall biosynthesis
MSSYWRDDPSQLTQALESLAAQTAPPAEVIIVVGGEVPGPLNAVFEKFREPLGLRIVRQEKNEGLGSALQLGLENCAHDLVARMDGDDVCFPDRIARQHAFMESHPEIGILMSWHAEFETEPGKVNAIKQTPQSDADICAKLPWRNIVSHPTIMMRRGVILDIGGYRSLPYSEDYDLWLRAKRDKVPMAAIQEPLLYMRVDRKQRVRRGGLHYGLTSVAWRWALFREKALTLPQFLITTPLYFLFHVIPADARGWFYRFVRRSPGVT